MVGSGPVGLSAAVRRLGKACDDGTLQQIHDQLCEAARTAAGRNITPGAAVIDSQSVRAADTVPKASRGWDNAKKVNGRKRHIAGALSCRDRCACLQAGDTC
jgi:hypothetical protein